MAPDGRCSFVSLGPFADRSGKVGEVEVLQCCHCKLAVTLPPLPDVAFLYDGRESQDFQPNTTGLAHAIKDMAFKRQARALLAQVPDTPSRVLDFGCGSGQFTRCLGELLPGAEVVGSDFHSEPPVALAGRPYRAIGDLGELADSFDLVTAFHVLEHDDDAAGLLARIVAMARPGGTVVLEVPNVECVWGRVLGPAWDAWYVPFHRTHFSRASLERLVAAGGLETLAVHQAVVPSMGRSLANMAGMGNSLPFLLAGIALHPVQLAGEKLTGQPSAWRVIARRKA